MKNSALPRPTTFLLFVALATLALLVASCGSHTADSGTATSQTSSTQTSVTVNADHTALDSANESIDELGSLLDGINSDIDSVLGDLAADAAATVLGND